MLILAGILFTFKKLLFSILVGTLSWKGWKPCSSCNCNSDINNRSWLNYSAENTDLTQPSATRATQTYPGINRCYLDAKYLDGAQRKNN